MTEINFKHRMAAHCESGTVAAQLNHAGLEISEPMVFGIGSGIFFGYFELKSFPFPTFVLRNRPGQIRKNTSRLLGVKYFTKKFRSPSEGERELDALIEKGIPVSCQADFFYMKFLPEYARVHINVHYITVVGKNGDNYLISDSYYPEIAELDRESLTKGRFAGGSFAPGGFIFYPDYIPEKINIENAMKKGIKKAAFNMLKIPLPFLGVRGIRLFSKKILEWPTLARDLEHLSHEIMKINVFLEDQGTGGGGFRFIYASFLQEASGILNSPALSEMSKRIMEIGDNWRKISLFTARSGKNRSLDRGTFLELSSLIAGMADQEELFFKDLLKISKGL